MGKRRIPKPKYIRVTNYLGKPLEFRKDSSSLPTHTMLVCLEVKVRVGRVHIREDVFEYPPGTEVKVLSYREASLHERQYRGRFGTLCHVMTPDYRFSSDVPLTHLKVHELQQLQHDLTA